MSEDFDADLTKTVAAISCVTDLRDRAIKDYYKACEEWNWAAAETARAIVLAHTEAMLDQIGCAHKRLESHFGPRLEAERGQR